MTEIYAITPPPRPVLPVAGSGSGFPVHRIFCIGRNYEAHAREMGHSDRDPPFFFTKAGDAVVESGATIPYPPGTEDFHFEIELVAALAEGGADIGEDEALSHLFGYAVGIDLTRRDLQARAKEMGRPWDIGKDFDHSAPCTAIHPVSSVGHPLENDIWLDQNGKRRQSGNTAQMIWKVPEIIRILSSYFTLKPGDLIFTGTPAGVGPIERGDRLEGGVEGLGGIELRIE